MRVFYSGETGKLESSELPPFFKKTLSPTPGTGDSYGDEVEYDKTCGAIVLLGGEIEFGGTFATGETATVKITAYYNDGTSANIEKSATATGTTVLTLGDILDLVKDGKYIYKIGASSKSDQSSTSVTTSVSIYGL